MLHLSSVTLEDISRFQRCRALGASDIPYPQDKKTRYYQVIKDTLYFWIFNQLSKGRIPAKDTVRNFWDKRWLEYFNSYKIADTLDQKDLFELALSGWLILEELYTYISDREWQPLGANFIFPLQVKDITYKIHYDAVYLDKGGEELRILTFENLPTGLMRYGALTSRLEVLGLLALTDKAPIEKLSVNLGKKGVEHLISSLTISPAYIKDSKRLITGLTYDIMHGIIYPTPGEHCKQCPVFTSGSTDPCWYSGGMND